jgi:hypothetical protein
MAVSPALGCARRVIAPGAPFFLAGSNPMPDATAQTKKRNIFAVKDEFWEVGPFCWNCELVDAEDFNAMDADVPEYFCSAQCKREYWSEQPLKNFLSKRKNRLCK